MAMSGPGPIVALDVGGTTVKGAVDTGSGARAHRRWRTPREQGPDAVVATVLDAAQELVELTREVAGRPPARIGMACLGLVDPVMGVAVLSAATGWTEVPLAALVRARTGVPVSLVHDVGAAALAEAHHRPRSVAPLFFLAIGTGIGGATIIDGRPVLGGHHRPGEIGHVGVPGCDELCGCGRRGCLELVASAAGLVRGYVGRTGQEVSGAVEIARRADAGDRDAAAVWERGVGALVDALTACSLVLDPDVIVIGGGVALAGEQLIRPIQDGLTERLGVLGAPTVETARLGDNAALSGAFLAAAQSESESEPESLR